MKLPFTTLRKVGIFVCGLLLPVISQAHVHWHRVNSADSRTVALYHFDSSSGSLSFGDTITPAAGLGSDKTLSVVTEGSPKGEYTADTAGNIFNPGALNLPSVQTIESATSFENLDGDLTIEFWFKWNANSTRSQLTVGLKSGAKILIARDTADISYDKLGVSATHGSYVGIPEFTNWEDVGEEEADLNTWRHLALVIRSTGIEYDSTAAHDVYKAGTVGMFYYNGHLLGAAPGTFSLAGLKAHPASAIQIRMVQGGNMTIDEFTIWKHDFSENGTVSNPFSNGRGDNSSVGDWNLY